MSGGWTVVDANSNKSLPITGTNNSGAVSPYFAPATAFQDPVGKMRISSPQALIDTDFEYGQQPTKWESISLQNSRQSLYYISQQPRTITAVTGNATRTVVISMASTTGFSVGSPIYVQNAADANANGWYYVEAVNTNVSVTYTASGTVASGNQYNAALTYVYLGYFYSSCGILLGSTSAFSSSGTTTTVTTSNAHGLSAGSLIYVQNVTSVAANATNGWISGTVMYFNAVPSAGLALRTGYSVTGAGVTGGTTITAVNTAVSTGVINTNVLSVTSGAAQVVGNQLSGTGVTAGTYVTAVNTASFVGDINGTALTYTSGTVPTVGMVLSDTTTPANLPAGVYIVSGTSPNFVLSAAGTTSTTQSINGTSYTVSASQTVASTTITGYNYTVSASQTVGSIGSPVALTVSSTAVANAPNGAWVVATVPTANTFTYTTLNTMFGTNSNTANNTTLYARPAGYVESRSFDGGVAFSAGATVPNSQLIRQTRRYFRYQSGKGIQFSTGTTLCPALFITSITSAGSTATVTTRFAHNLAVGCTILVNGCDQGTYNGSYTIATVPSPTTFTYTMQATPSASPATGFPIRVSPTNWYGSSNRIGMFDQQNGLFFEYDGQNLYAVWRNSINQINGTVSVTNGSENVTGTGTQFSTQLKPGDFIVIRGQTYRVLTITSDTALILTQEYLGSTIAGALVSKTVDTRVPRSLWLDPLDGTGPSGYTLDLTKMQMFYIDYSWYGAGFVRWGLRTSKGQITYVYQQTNNNQRFEAYMRSGNMASHYESSGLTSYTYLTATLANTTTTGGLIRVADTSGFAPSGTVKIQASGGTGAVEYITYSAKTANSLTITARAQTGGNGTAQTFTYSATAPIQVEYASPDTVASLSHWGSSVIMDGQFNDDKSLVFNYGTTTAVSTSSTTPVVLMAIRVAPAVDNGQSGLLGAKEIINRMQLQLDSLGIVTTGNTYLINLILNGYASGAFSGSFTSPIQLTNGITSSLAQIAVNTNAVTVTGGESVAAAFCIANGVTTLDLSNVRDLGNSILGGGTSNTVPTSQSGFYPDGPDILYVVAQAVSATAGTILARLSWKEAQA